MNDKYRSMNADINRSWEITGALDPVTIKHNLPGCVRVRRATKSQDLRGVDFIADLDGGRKVRIDSKPRFGSAKRHWKPHATGVLVPEIVLETWSTVPGTNPLRGEEGTIGWALKTSSVTDYYLFTFDSADTDRCYLLAADELRRAMLDNPQWPARYKLVRSWTRSDDGTKWQSECVILPITEVKRACTAAQDWRSARLVSEDPLVVEPPRRRA